MKIAIAADHAGFDLKKILIAWLKTYEYQILDFGCFSTDSVDYPDYAFPASEAVAAGVADFGVLICGTGVGMAMTANKIMGIRAANCCSVQQAELARQHNNANVLTLGARITETEDSKKIVLAFLEGEFEGGRHMVRIEKIHSLTGF